MLYKGLVHVFQRFRACFTRVWYMFFRGSVHALQGFGTCFFRGLGQNPEGENPLRCPFSISTKPRIRGR